MDQGVRGSNPAASISFNLSRSISRTDLLRYRSTYYDRKCSREQVRKDGDDKMEKRIQEIRNMKPKKKPSKNNKYERVLMKNK